LNATEPRDVKAMYQATRHDLILLDIQMPELDGFGVMAQLDEIKGDDYLPIIVLAAAQDTDTRHRSLQAGAKDFLTKPFDTVEALNRIRNLLEVRLLHNQVCDYNEVLEDKVRERTRELEETRLDIIRRLGRAAEYRDNETGMHVIRMSKFSELLAREAGMSESDCHGLLTAAPMHDIGKIGIPDNILLKDGPLEPEEWEIMKTHSAIGAELLEGYDYGVLALARELALTHHEKWDGGGYPKGLKGEEISLDARILMICDVFDALTSERPYKKAWSVEDAVAEIEKCVGSHFDPDLVPLFMKILPEIIKIREEFHD